MNEVVQVYIIYMLNVYTCICNFVHYNIFCNISISILIFVKIVFTHKNCTFPINILMFNYNSKLDFSILYCIFTLQSIPNGILPYCTRVDDSDLRVTVHHRIVVCTCNSCGLLFGLGLSTDHFTHVFVDEAGQATEPECLIPVSMAAQAGGQVPS